MHRSPLRFLLVAALLALAAPTAAPAPRISVPYEMFRLPNGLTVIVHEDHSAPMVA